MGHTSLFVHKITSKEPLEGKVNPINGPYNAPYNDIALVVRISQIMQVKALVRPRISLDGPWIAGSFKTWLNHNKRAGRHRSVLNSPPTDGINIRLAESPEDYQAFVDLAREYIDSLGFQVDFQDVGQEIAEAEHRYGESGRGAALLVVSHTGAAVGITALHDLGDEVCELKRMYLKPAYRGGGVGKKLLEESISVAKGLGYRAMRLDTLKRMTAARSLYESQGFRPIPPYTINPMPDALFYELDLKSAA